MAEELWISTGGERSADPYPQRSPVHGSLDSSHRPATLLLDGRSVRVARYLNTWGVTSRMEGKLGEGWAVELEDERRLVVYRDQLRNTCFLAGSYDGGNALAGSPAEWPRTRGCGKDQTL